MEPNSTADHKFVFFLQSISQGFGVLTTTIAFVERRGRARSFHRRGTAASAGSVALAPGARPACRVGSQSSRF